MIKSYKFTMFDSVIANVIEGVNGVNIKRKLWIALKPDYRTTGS